VGGTGGGGGGGWSPVTLCRKQQSQQYSAQVRKVIKTGSFIISELHRVLVLRASLILLPPHPATPPRALSTAPVCACLRACCVAAKGTRKRNEAGDFEAEVRRRTSPMIFRAPLLYCVSNHRKASEIARPDLQARKALGATADGARVGEAANDNNSGPKNRGRESRGPEAGPLSASTRPVGHFPGRI
jgi:hypothetical protein